ncbi:MAG: hypothetical protein GW859_05365 [Sphingomonadales bacterium]|nr:hypothetical protein [Sphingomonadales bacterium]
MTDRSPTIHPVRCRCTRCRGPITIRRQPRPLRWQPHPFLWVFLFLLVFWGGVAALAWFAIA